MRDVFGDLPGDDRGRAVIRLLHQTDLEPGFANDVQHSAADNATHVEFPAGVRGQVRRRVLDVAANRAARAGFGDDAADGAVAIETEGDVFEVFVCAAQQQRPGQSPPERGRGRGRG